VPEQMRSGIDGCLLMGTDVALAAPIEAATKCPDFLTRARKQHLQQYMIFEIHSIANTTHLRNSLSAISLYS
jgi:hypothetical protein